MSIRKEVNIRKYTGGGNVGGVAETVMTLEMVIRH
jgi:hypothetical protein